MKKLLAILLACVMLLALVSCWTPEHTHSFVEGKCECGETDPNYKPELTDEEILAALPIMSYEEYVAAAIDDPIAVECYVQAHQSWWDNKITVYAADEDGAYFLYELACSEADAAKLTPGTKIEVRGYKAEWSGEFEIVDATFKFLEGDSYVAEAEDLTELLGTDELIDYQNQYVSFSGLFVEKVEYQNGSRGKDIYLTVRRMGQSYDFCVESYLTSPDSELYQAVEALQVGDLINVSGFLYWYNGANPHITEVEKLDVMTYAEYDAAALNDEVVVDVFVQGNQSWWDNKITVYAADENGAYFLYEMNCTEADKALITAGAKLRVHGYKAEWSGEVEIVDCHFIALESEPYIAEAKDLTEKLGTDELVTYQNQYASFKGLTVVSVEYQNGAPGKDIYLTVSLNGAEYSFCVESYLTAPDSELYAAVGALQAGQTIDVTGFLYWYNGANPHITALTVK